MRRKTQGRSDYPFGNQPDRQGLDKPDRPNRPDKQDGPDQPDRPATSRVKEGMVAGTVLLFLPTPHLKNSTSGQSRHSGGVDVFLMQEAAVTAARKDTSNHFSLFRSMLITKTGSNVN